jgi:hypothetical protein
MDVTVSGRAGHGGKNKKTPVHRTGSFFRERQAPLFGRQIGTARADVTGQPAKTCPTPADSGDHDTAVPILTSLMARKT